MGKQVELAQGTLDMLNLQAVSIGGLHGYGILPSPELSARRW